MKSIKMQLVTFFGSTIILLLVIAAVLMYFQISGTVVPLIEDYTQQIIDMRAAEIGNIVSDHARSLRRRADEFMFGHMADMAPLSENERRNYTNMVRNELTRLRDELHQEYDYAFFVDTVGTHYDTRSLDEVTDASQEEFFQAIVRDEQPYYVFNPHLSGITGLPSVSIAHEVINSQGLRVGIMGGVVSIEAIDGIARDTAIVSGGYGWIVDGHGQIISHPDEELTLHVTLSQGEQYGYQGFDQIEQIARNQERGRSTITLPSEQAAMVFQAPIPNTPGWSFAVTAGTSQIMERANHLLRFTLVVFAIIILAGVLVSLLLANNITKPIIQIADYLDRIAHGDLRSTLEIKRNDEIGRIAEAYNLMSNNLQEMVTRLKTIIARLSEGSNHLSVASTENLSALEEIAATVQTFANTVETSSKDASEMGEKAQGALHLTDKGIEQMKVTQEKMEEVADSSRRSKEAITNVEEASNEIVTVVDLISDIAGQTNLLALNAAIEAARAGEQGRGFAVVADEVRKLAEQTQSSIENIRRIVNTLNEETGQAVAVIDENSNQVSQSHGVLMQTQTDFATIADNITETVASFRKVVATSKELANNSQDISATTEQQSASTGEIARSAESLAKLSEELEEVVSRFQV